MLRALNDALQAIISRPITLVRSTGFPYQPIGCHDWVRQWIRALECCLSPLKDKSFPDRLRHIHYTNPRTQKKKRKYYGSLQIHLWHLSGQEPSVHHGSILWDTWQPQKKKVFRAFTGSKIRPHVFLLLRECGSRLAHPPWWVCHSNTLSTVARPALIRTGETFPLVFRIQCYHLHCKCLPTRPRGLHPHVVGMLRFRSLT